MKGWLSKRFRMWIKGYLIWLDIECRGISKWADTNVDISANDTLPGYLLVWWCLTPLSTIFHLYRAGQFYWFRKPGRLGENHRPVANHWQTLSHNVVHLALIEIRTHNISGDWHPTQCELLHQVRSKSKRPE